MPEIDTEHWKQHFTIHCDRVIMGFHIGATIAVQPSSISHVPDVYLLLYLGIIDISVGLMTDYIDTKK